MPRVGRGRKHNKNHPLGKIIDERGLGSHDVAAMSGVYERTLSSYLANRFPISQAHLALLSNALDVDPQDLIPTQPPMFPSERAYRTARENAKRVGLSWSTKVSPSR